MQESSEPEVPVTPEEPQEVVTGVTADPDEEIPTMADLYDGFEDLEVGEAMNLFGDDAADDAPVSKEQAEEPAAKPEEKQTFTKQVAEAPVVNVAGLSGFLWQ